MQIHFEAYGCTLNRGEAKLLEERADEAGHRVLGADQAADADLHVIATCTVIGTTERRMLKRISALVSTGRPVIVAGCMAAVQRESIATAVDAAKDQLSFLPPSELASFPSLLASIASSKVDGTALHRSASAPTPCTIETAIGIVPIASGCMGNCAYCITKLARGQLRSRPVQWVVERARTLLAEGACELQLTAQDTASYGREHGDEGDTSSDVVRLPALIDALVALEGEYNLRVGMMDPDTALAVLDPLIAAYGHERVFRFLHLPLQSGSDPVLERMGRRYTIDDYVAVVRAFRSAFPELTLATDVIVGFPGETAADFDATIDAIEELAPDIVNITRFSPRPGTRAAAMADQLVSRHVKERSRRLTALRFAISEERNRRFIGRTLKVLVTKRGKRGTHTMIGRDENYRVVVFDHHDILRTELIGTRQRVEIVDARSVYLIGELDAQNPR